MYEIAVPVTGWIIYQVEAKNEEDAKGQLKKFPCSFVSAEYDVDRDMDPSKWEVQKI